MYFFDVQSERKAQTRIRLLRLLRPLQAGNMNSPSPYYRQMFQLRRLLHHLLIHFIDAFLPSQEDLRAG